MRGQRQKEQAGRLAHNPSLSDIALSVSTTTITSANHQGLVIYKKMFLKLLELLSSALTLPVFIFDYHNN